MMGKQQINELFVNNTQNTKHNISGIGTSRGWIRFIKLQKLSSGHVSDGKIQICCDGIQGLDELCAVCRCDHSPGNIWGGILLRFVRPPRSGIITSIFMADADTEWRCCYTSSRSHEQCAASAVCRKHLLAASSQTMESKVTLTW